MMCRINLSLLCAALTRQSLGFMADWICVIKDDKQNHLLVTSICHRQAFAISHTSLKNNCKMWRASEKGGRGGPYAATSQGEAGGRVAKRLDGARETQAASVGKWLMERGQTQQEKVETDGEFLLLNCRCCPLLPSDCQLWQCCASSNQHTLPPGGSVPPRGMQSRLWTYSGGSTIGAGAVYVVLWLVETF